MLTEVGEHIGILYDDFHFASSSTFGKDVWPWIWSCSCSLKQRSARNNNYKTILKIKNEIILHIINSNHGRQNCTLTRRITQFYASLVPGRVYMCSES